MATYVWKVNRMAIGMSLSAQGAPNIFRFIVRPLSSIDSRSAGYLTDAHALGLVNLESIICQDIIFVEGHLSQGELDWLGANLLSDPIIQAYELTILDHSFLTTRPGGDYQFLVEVALRPGVTDPVADQIVRAAQVLGIQGVTRASTGYRFLLSGKKLDVEQIHLLANRLLANSTIQRYELGQITPVFPQAAQASSTVELFPIGSMTSDELVALSLERRAALDPDEMLVIQQYFRQKQRDMTDIEFETIAQTWSEHCVHKTFKALISVHSPGDTTYGSSSENLKIDNLLNTYLRAATEQINADWVLSAFVDNAGIIEFDDLFEVSFKVETHNHPSAIEPFGGANTGTGGVIRDVLGVSAKPIAATNVLCFGLPHTAFHDLPSGVLHPRRIRSGVVAGIQDYGNKIGVPTVSGAILYDSGYTANPLVFCGCVGLAPKNSHPRVPIPGDRIIVLGGRTGRDGLRGATFSSMTMDAKTGEVAGASVQIGAPIVEKGLIDVIMQARDLSLYHAITDCGAGGLSSAVGEMAATTGAEVALDQVQLKYAGLAPWEIWLSEAQERMVLAVPPTALLQLEELCQIYSVELTDIGRFTESGRLIVRYQDACVLDLENNLLHHGIPQRHLDAIISTREAGAQPVPCPKIDYTQTLKSLISHPNIASKAPVIRIYDHEVQGGTVLKPLTGACDDGPSDGVVLKPGGTPGKTAIILGAGINPEYGKHDPYRMAWAVIDEAIRNAVAVGADPTRIALLDNFCWGDPKNPAILGSLVEAARGCHDAALTYQTPFISGKDSLNNEYFGTDGKRHAIPPTLLISSLGVIPDYDLVVSMDLKRAGNPVYLVGNFEPHFQGSHFSLITGLAFQDGVPMPSHQAAVVYKQLYKAIQKSYVCACHDLSEGGLAVAAAEMCIGGRIGLNLDLPEQNQALILFGETSGCLLVEVRAEFADDFEKLFTNFSAWRIGQVTDNDYLRISELESAILTVSIAELVADWQTVH